MNPPDTFDEMSLPDLDEAVIGALELFAAVEPPPLAPLAELERPLVVGSVNALSTGKIIFSERDAVFADEGSYERVFAASGQGIDGVVLVSASGGKHARGAAAFFADAGVPVWLLTAAEDAPAARELDPSRVLVFPKNPEPYTYNVSTYLGMILAATGESPEDILAYLAETAPYLPDDFGDYRAFCLIVPPAFGEACAMFRTKFDELFGPKVAARAFTSEEVKHAKTLVRAEDEFFLSLGEAYPDRSVEQLCTPLPKGADYATVLSLGYFVIGAVQRQHPPYFKKNLADYAERASEAFGERITPIVI